MVPCARERAAVPGAVRSNDGTSAAAVARAATGHGPDSARLLGGLLLGLLDGLLRGGLLGGLLRRSVVGRLTPSGLGGVHRALQRGEQVDDLTGGLGRRRRLLDRAALDRVLDHGLDGLGVVVLELAGIEVTGQ